VESRAGEGACLAKEPEGVDAVRARLAAWCASADEVKTEPWGDGHGRERDGKVVCHSGARLVKRAWRRGGHVTASRYCPW
jgi:hypothetical protein